MPALGVLAQDPGGPKISVTGPEKTSPVELHGDEEREDRMSGSLSLVISNTGTRPTGLVPHAYLDVTGGKADRECTPDSAVEAVISLRSGKKEIVPEEAVPADVKLDVPEHCVGREGTLVVSGDADSEPATVRFTLARPGSAVGYAPALLLALGLTVIFLFLTSPLTRWPVGRLPGNWLSSEVPLESPWAVKDSWLTNVAALGAVLGTVLTASGFLQDWLPGLRVGPALGLNIWFGGMILFAPIVYAASCTWRWSGGVSADEDDVKPQVVGHGWGLVLGAATTLFAILGELGTIGALTLASHMDIGPKGMLLVFLGLAALAVMAYAVRFVRGVISQSPEGPIVPMSGSAAAL